MGSRFFPGSQTMLCERCGRRQAVRVSTSVVEGRKVASYLCGPCEKGGTAQGAPLPERPCAFCRAAEGTVKLVRLKSDIREVVYVCEACVGAGKRRM